VKTLIVDSTVVCRMKKADIIDNSRIEAGNVIIGLSASGKANYEEDYNGGMGSNGLTSARHDVFSKIYADKYPESFDNAIDKSVVYSGTCILNDEIKIDDEISVTAGKLVLSPTRTYAPIIKKIFEKYRPQINGMVHCSGGGQTKILHFLNSDLSVTKDQLFEIPPLFTLIQKESKTDWQEMYKVFNMGHRMELYVPKSISEEIIAISKSFGVDAKIIGNVKVKDVNDARLTIKSDKGTFTYN
jgi:phosphoribosylformylglycinamidine cyclo-ligase